MIKKVIIFILVLSLTFVLFIQPVSAAETTGQYINLLDYCGIDGTSFNSFSFSGSRSVNYNFRDTLGSVAIHSVEITYSFSGNATNLSSITFDGSSVSFNERSVGNGVYRVRFNAGGSLGSLFTLTFRNAGTSSVNILCFNCYLVSTSDYSLSGVIRSGSKATSFYPGSYSNLNVSSSDNVIFRVEIDNWRNYDQITLDGMITCDTVSSIDVVLEANTSADEWVVPLKNNYISPGDTSDSSNTIFNFNLYADLTGLDRTSIPDSTLVFVFSVVSVSSSSSCYFQLDDSRGFVFSGDLDPNGRMLLALYVMIRQQTGDISTSIGSFQDSFIDLFSELMSKYSNHTEFIETFLSGYEALLGELYGENGYYYQLIYRPLLEIITLLSPTSSNGSSTNEMQSAGDELAGLGQQISSGTPQVDTSGDIVLGDIPDDGSGVLASTIFDFLWSSDYIISMIISVIGIATLGYVFFGKKG